MKQKTYFITGISTDVGKTVASAIVTQALEADYWKPVQAGDLHLSDTHKVQHLVSNDISQYHDNAYALETPMSPHAAAAIDGVTIKIKDITRPSTKNNLVIEGAGGVLVPLNEQQTIADLIIPTDRVIVVSRHYLGSINHTLLTVKYLQQQGVDHIAILFSGEAHPTTESIIKKMTSATILGRIDQEPYVDARVIEEYAERFRESLISL